MISTLNICFNRSWICKTPSFKIICPLLRASLLTTAWWIGLFTSSSVVAPFLFVLSSTRATQPSSLPSRGSFKGSPALAASAWSFKARNKSSKNSGNVSALPRAPNRCRAMCATECSSLGFLILYMTYRASIVMHVIVVHGLAQIASMTVTLYTLPSSGAHTRSTCHLQGSVVEACPPTNLACTLCK